MSDIPFVIGDKSVADAENEKFAKIQQLLEESNLSPEDLTAISESVLQWAQDAALDTIDTEQEIL